MRFADLISFLAVESRYLVPGMIIREPQKSIRNRKFYDVESKKAPPKRGKKLSFFDWNPKLAISLIALISPVPMCYHKLRSIFQLIS